MSKIAGNSNQRERHPLDHYPTPQSAVDTLLAHVKLSDTVWEPACGQLDISRVLQKAGHTVISTDIIHNQDFFKYDDAITHDIVTNPPFSHGLKFVEHALRLTSGNVCMLLPIGFMTSLSRFHLMRSGKLVQAIVLVKRLKIKTHYGEVSSQFNHVWYVFNNLNQTAPILGFA